MAYSADFVLQEVKGIKESLDLGSKLVIEQYMASKIFNMEDTTQWTEIFSSTESMAGTRELGELEAPDVTSLDEGFSKTLTASRFGNAIEVSETAMQKMKDGTLKVDTFLTRERDRVLRSVKNYFIVDIHRMLNTAFVTTSFAAPDGVALCGTHSWNTPGASTWNNKVTTAKLSSSSVDDMMEFGGAFLDAAGQPDPQTYDTIVVKLGSDNHREAIRLFAKDIKPTAIADINVYQGGEFMIVATPYITTANKNYWFTMDLKVRPSPLYVGITQMPSMKDPIKQNNEAIRTNVTGFWKKGINMLPVNLAGSDGTT